MEKENKKENWECDCPKCVECYWHNPGWFGSKEEIKGAAKIMKMPLKDFIKEYLIQEWLAGYDDVIIPAPRRNFQKGREDATKGGEWDKEIIRNGKGFVIASFAYNLMDGWACIFLDDNNKCLIHQSKPKECKESFGCKREGKFKDRKSLLPYWRKYQDFIRKYAE